MATLAPRSPPLSPPRRRKNFVRRCERCCCNIITYFPLVFVYGMTSWAVWVEVNISMLPSRGRWTGNFPSALGILLYILLNWSYSTAVFTDPGSTIESKHGYSHLPTNEADRIVSITQKSTGEMRFCKKCQAKKPDRAHHCSTCRRCVLKMDHHCPWLATCVGLRNYKPFILFITYTSLFCWACFFVSGTWLWVELVSGEALEESLMPVNFILLAVLSGIIGLVLSGFTGWHIWLACRARTTIESLEKVRYLSPVRRAVQHQVEAQRHYIDGPSIANQLVTIHANALPGVTRPEEGEERSSPARDSLRQTWDDMERQRERDRYNEYLDEKDSENLPNAFDHGWRRNLIHVLGENPWLRAFPICNTTGDGWRWEPSKKWIEARDRVAKEREWEARMQTARESAAGWGYGHGGYPAHNDSSPGPQEPHHHSHYLPRSRTSTPNKADRILGRSPEQYTDGAISMGDATPLQDLSRRSDIVDDGYDTSSDEEIFNRRLLQQRQRRSIQSSSPAKAQNSNWNDIPDDLLTTHGDRRSPSRLRSSAGRTH